MVRGFGAPELHITTELPDTKGPTPCVGYTVGASYTYLSHVLKHRLNPGPLLNMLKRFMINRSLMKKERVNQVENWYELVLLFSFSSPTHQCCLETHWPPDFLLAWTVMPVEIGWNLRRRISGTPKSAFEIHTCTPKKIGLQSNFEAPLRNLYHLCLFFSSFTWMPMLPGVLERTRSMSCGFSHLRGAFCLPLLLSPDDFSLFGGYEVDCWTYKFSTK